MLKKFKNKEELDIEKINDTISTMDKILKIAYFLIIILGAFFIIKVFQELHIGKFLTVILKILIPLFIGLFLAWLFAPIVKRLSKKGIKRGLGTTIVYIVFLGLIAVIVCSIVPILTNQINEFVNSIPSIFDSIQKWINDVLGKTSDVGGIDIDGFVNNMYSKMEEYGSSLATTLPDLAVSTVKTLA